MRKLFYGLFNLLVLAALAWAAWWAWQNYSTPGPAAARSADVLDIDKRCWVIADTGQCICRHRRTDERLSVPYDECVELARKR